MDGGANLRKIDHVLPLQTEATLPKANDAIALGAELGPWQIKDFSVRLRQQITQAARRQDCTLADWLHAHFQKYGIDGLQVDAVKLAPALPAPNGHGGDNRDAERIDLLVSAAVRLGSAKGVARNVRRRLNEALELMVGGDSLVPAVPPARLLAGPEK